MLAREDELRVGEKNARLENLSVGERVKAGDQFAEERDDSKVKGPRLRGEILEPVEEVFGLVFVLLQAGARRECPENHTKLLSMLAWSPHESGWKEDS
jgi:hypothetical protein